MILGNITDVPGRERLDRERLERAVPWPGVGAWLWGFPGVLGFRLGVLSGFPCGGVLRVGAGVLLVPDVRSPGVIARRWRRPEEAP